MPGLKVTRAMDRYDWIVALMTVVIWCWLISVSVRVFEVNMLLAVFGSLLSVSVLLLWMVRGGAESTLWSWLPPFWPWGYITKSSAGRWLVILAMALGSTVGVIANALRYTGI